MFYDATVVASAARITFTLHYCQLSKISLISFTLRRNFIHIMKFDEDYARRLAKFEKEDIDTLSEWVKSIRCI